jgi:hypothetical protein
MMRLEIKTDSLRFRVAGTAKPRPDYKDKDKQAVMRDGRPIWTVRLNAIDTNTEHGSSESIWVEVAGDEPRLTLDELANVRGLVFAPWVGRDGKIRRAFRADAVELAAANGKSPAHAA